MALCLHLLAKHARAKSKHWWYTLLQQSNCLESIIGPWISPFAIGFRSLQYRSSLSEDFAI
jgi:hypothetical protein